MNILTRLQSESVVSSLLEVMFCSVDSGVGNSLYVVFKWFLLLFKWKLAEMYHIFREGRVIS